MNAPMTQSMLLRVRFGAAFAALGAFLTLAVGVFLLPFFLSPYAIQNDVYMANLFLAPLFLLAGIVGLLTGAISLYRSARPLGVGQVWLRALVIAVVGAGVVTIASWLVGGRFESFPPGSVIWPPYLNGWLLAVVVATGAAVAVAGWLWGPSGLAGGRLRGSELS